MSMPIPDLTLVLTARRLLAASEYYTRRLHAGGAKSGWQCHDSLFGLHLLIAGDDMSDPAHVVAARMRIAALALSAIFSFASLAIAANEKTAESDLADLPPTPPPPRLPAAGIELTPRLLPIPELARA